MGLERSHKEIKTEVYTSVRGYASHHQATVEAQSPQRSSQVYADVRDNDIDVEGSKFACVLVLHAPYNLRILYAIFSVFSEDLNFTSRFALSAV